MHSLTHSLTHTSSNTNSLFFYRSIFGHLSFKPISLQINLSSFSSLSLGTRKSSFLQLFHFFVAAESFFSLSHFLSVVRVSICFLLSAGSTNTAPVIQNIFLPIFLRLFLSFSFNLSQYLDAFSVIATYYFESFSTFLSPSQIYFLHFLRYTFSLSLILSLQPCCPINCPSFFLLSPRVSLLFERQFIKDRRFSFFIITQHFLKVDNLTGY